MNRPTDTICETTDMVDVLPGGYAGGRAVHCEGCGWIIWPELRGSTGNVRLPAHFADSGLRPRPEGRGDGCCYDERPAPQ